MFDYKEFLDSHEGVLNLMPVFIPRFCGHAGGRLRLHPDDMYPYGIRRGAIKERWFSSILRANNGPLTEPDEGMSYVNVDDSGAHRVLLKDFVEALGAQLLGETLMKRYGTWPMYSKFYDFNGPLQHHLHLDFEAAAEIGELGKPECYYYPVQYNNHPGNFPHTYFGFSPEVTRDEVRERLDIFNDRDNNITELSRAFRIQLGTGWYTPPGVVHAPGSYLTYEPQWNSDVNSSFSNSTDGEYLLWDQLVRCLPEEKQNVDGAMALLDWEKNVDPDYRKHYFRPPLVLEENADYTEKWICYGNEYIAAKELTVQPGKKVVIRDDVAYGLIITQGWGRIQGYDCATACCLRFGGISQDEFFVSAQRAGQGLVIENRSNCEPLVMLKHFPNYDRVPKTDE